MATPTLDEFLSAARADNPGVSDGQLASYWLKTYAGGRGELPKSEATAGGLIRSFGSSAIDTVGSAFQGGGEVVASGLRAATGNQDIRAANPLRPVTDAIRGGMSEGDKLASQDTFKGDITSPSTIELPKTAGGWAHAIASGFGSLSSMILPGAMAATGARGMIMAGAATGALTTGGAAADEVRQNVQKAMEGQSPDQLAQSIPAYREARLQGMDDGTARQKVENDAAILATTIAGAAGAVGGAFNAKVLEDVVAKRGLATLLGKASASKAGQIGIGAGIGTVAEGLQEGLEKVGQNVGENLGLGRPAMENATRDTAGDVIMGGLIGGVTGGGAGAITRRPAEAEAVKEKVERAAAVQDIATAPNVDAAIEAFGRATAAPAVEFGVDEAAEILRHGKNRLAALEAISQGTKGGQSIDVDGQMVKMPDQMGRFFTPEEKQEYDFLRRNQGNLKAIAQAYGFKPAGGVEYDRLGALGMINAPAAPAAPVDTGEAIPYDYSTRQQMYPALPAPEMPSGRNVLVNDTDPQLTRPEQIGDREAAINFEQRQREQADSDRELGITRRQRITLDEAGNILDAPDGDRQFLSLVRREARPHAAAAIEAHAINPTLTEAVLAAPDMGPKAERAVFEAITNGTTGSPETRDILARHGLADANGQGKIPLNPAPPGQQPAGDTGSERRPAENGTPGTGADAAADNRSQGVSPFQMRGKWLHDMHAGALNLIARNSKSLVERAKARAELDRRNPNREFDRAAHDARKRLWRAIVQAGGISENEAADIGIDPRSLGGYRMSGLITPNGMRGDILARFLAESGNGWLQPDQADDDNAARQLVADLLAREAIGTPDEQNRYHELLAKKHGEAVAAAIDTLPEVEQAQVADYDDSVLALAAEEFDAALDAEPNMTVADAMRALGFTDEEIRNAEQPASEERETVDAETGRDEPGSPSSSGESGIRETERGEGAEAGERGDQEGAATAVVKRPDTQQDLSRREWQDNYDRVANAPDLSKISTKDIERAINYASHRLASEGRKGWDGGQANTALMDSIRREIDNLKFALKQRQAPAAKPPATTPRLYVQSPDGRRFEVESYEDASRKWLASGETEQRARNMATGAVPIVDQDGKTVALMGVNGRVTAFDGTGVLYAPPEADVTPAKAKTQARLKGQKAAGVAAPLYASRPVTNAADIIAWAQSQGFKTTLPAGDLHVTVAYSTAPLDGAAVPATGKILKVLGDKRSVEPLGDEGAVVLKFTSKALQNRWQAYRDAGASWDYDGYQPHITLTYDGQGVDLSKVEPYRGPINLGPEKQEPLNEDKADEYVEQPTSDQPPPTPVAESQAPAPEAGDRGVAPAQEKGAAETATAIFGLSGAQLEAMQGGKLRGAKQFTGIAPTEQQVADRKALVAKRKAEEAAAVDKAALDPRIAALRDSGVEAGILLKAEKELRAGDDSLIKDLARIQGIELPAEPAPRETPNTDDAGGNDAPLASRRAPDEDVDDMFGYTDADEDTLLLDMDAQERAEYEKSKPRGVSWLDHAKERFSRINADYRGGRGRSFISATYGADSPWQESARNRDGDDLQALRGEAVRLEKDAPAYLYVNEDGTARITVFDTRDVPKRMLAFAERNNLKTDVVVSSAMLQSGKAMPEVNRAAGAKYAAEMTRPDERNAFAARPGYTAPHRDLEKYRFTASKDDRGLPVYMSRNITLADGRVKDALGVPKGGRAIAFDIYDNRMRDQDGDPTVVGQVLVHQDAAGKFVSFRNISIAEKYQNQGYYHGEGVVAGMLQHNGTTPMQVFNIQSANRGDKDDALPFWKKIGTTILNYSSTQDVDIEGNISLSRYMQAGEKRGKDGQSSRDRREQPVPRRDGTRGEQSDSGGDRRAQSLRARQSGTVRAVRAELTEAFGEDGVAALEREGILNITTWDNAPKGLTNQLQSGDHGAYWPSRNAAYIFADNLAPGQAVEVLLHEIGEHYGLKAMLGGQYDRVIAQVKTLHKAGQPAIVEAWKHVQRNYDLEPGSPVFMQEVIAKAGQSAAVRKMAWWQRMVDSIKAFLLKTGLKGVTSERDLGILLQASVKKAMRDANGQSGPVAVGPDEYGLPSRNSIASQLRKRGQQITSRLDAERRWNDGERIFAFAEDDVTPYEITSFEELQQGNYTPDQMMALPADAPMASRPGTIGATWDMLQSASTPAQARAMFDESTAEPATPEETRTRLDSLKDSVRGMALGGFTRNQIADMYGKDIPEVADYNRMSADMDAMRANLAQDADRVLQAWRKLDRETADSVADIMHEATLGQYDPDTGKKGDDFGLPTATVNGMKARFDALPEAAKAVYRRARDMHNDRLRTLFDTLAARIQRSGADPEATRRTIDQLRQQYDRHLAKGPYFPLARFGDYLLIAERKEKTGADDDRMVMSFESAAARDKQSSIMRMKGYKTKATVAKAYSRAKDGSAGPLAEAMTEAIQKLDMDRLDLVAEGGKNLGDVKSQLLDELNQALIRGLPELSYRKHFIHRKGTPGFSRDAMRAFADSQLHAANHIARLEYGDQMVRKLNDLQESITEATEGDLTTAQQVANEMVKRHEVAMNHVTHPVAAMLGQLGFVMSLGASVASGVVNLMQTPLVTYPWLASKYGWSKTSAALAKAAKDYGRSPWEWESGLNAAKNERLSVDQRAMLKALEDKGKINTTLAHDLAGASSTDNLNQFSKYGSAWQRTMRMVGWTFHVPEVANRQVTALATYDLARQAGASHEAAMEAASKAIDATHFDYSGANRARYFEGNFRRVILMFKQYGQNIAYLYGRAGYQAFKGASKEEKAEARRLLAGMLTMQFAAAGALGLPFVGSVATVLSALAQGFGGDDEKWDWEVEFRKWLASTFGKDAGEALSHGLPRLALGWDIAGRIGQNDLFVRAPKKEQEGRDAYFAWMQALAGPVAGYALNGYLGVTDIAKGVSTMNGGMMMRGVEELMPAAVRNPLKAARFEAEEGLRTRSGEKQLELDGFEKLGQAMGFTPTRVSEMYEGLSAIKNKQHGIEVRRKELLDQLAAARQDKDLKGMGDARQEIREFNQRNPRSAITAETIQRSATSRGKREQNMRDGISLPRRQEYLRQEGAFANL